jgi:hypothetical protein
MALVGASRAPVRTVRIAGAKDKKLPPPMLLLFTKKKLD